LNFLAICYRGIVRLVPLDPFLLGAHYRPNLGLEPLGGEKSMSGQKNTSKLMGSSALHTLAASLVCAAVPFAAQAQSLPAGEGADMVGAVCSSCHQTNMIRMSSGYTRDQWDELTSYMVDMDGTPQKDVILDYLAAHFPPSNNRASTPVPGDMQLNITSWKVPKLGQRSRDPVEAEDGTIWWVGQFGNVLGHLDPRTGEMKEYTLPANALPHSVEIDRNGNIWYTGNGNGTVGMLKPGTEEFEVYKMPDPNARDPHTALFDENNTMFFTLQNSNMVGRLVPSTGEITLVTPPTPDSKPYGIKMDSEGTVWIACNGSNCLLSLDRDTMELTEHKLPKADTTVRRLDIAVDDTIWYVNSGLGYLGHFDPKTGEVEEWDSPSGRGSHPYAIAIVDGIIWYNESGVRPDMLVRFDPATEKFQSWPIQSGNIYAGIVRNMSTTRDGDLLMHQSGTNHLMRVNLD
jgi:virginiamycin B lyase